MITENATLNPLESLNRLSEERFNRLTRLATKVFNVPIALLSLINYADYCHKSAFGLTPSQASEVEAFYPYVLDQPLIVPNARTDGRFMNTPLVKADPFIGFYAAVALKLGDGKLLGILSLMDPRPQEFNEEELLTLTDFAKLIEAELNNSLLTEALKHSSPSQAFLREGEEKYRLLTESMEEMIILHDLEGNILYVSPSVTQVTGWTVAETLTRNGYDNMHPQDRERVATNAHKLNLEGQATTIQWRHKHKDGHHIWLETTSKVILDETGKPHRILASSRDITKRKQTEKELRESEARFRTLAENSPDFIYIIDLPSRKSLYFNKTELLGYTKAELQTPNSIIHAIHPADKEAVLEHYRQFGAELSTPIEYRMQTKSGEWEWIESRETVLTRDSTGQPEQVLFTLTVITKRKQIEQALATEKERLNVTLRSIGEAVITTDTFGQLILLNRVAEELIGWSQTEAFGQTLTDLLHLHSLDETQPNPITEVLERKEMTKSVTPFLLTGKTGREILVASTTAPILDYEGKLLGVVLVLRDVSQEQKQTEERLKTSKLEALGLLAGGIAHDFNNILTAILGNLSILKLHLRVEDEEVQSIEEAQKATLRARELTQQLLTFAKGGAPVKQKADLKELIYDSAEFVLHGSKVESEYQLAEKLWLVEVDTGQLSQVIQNLVINAIQAMPEGGKLKIAAENIVISDDRVNQIELREGNYVKLAIQDQGDGILPENLVRIFDPYFTTKESGSGLGLATCHSIVTRHEGRITVTSEVGRGTTFSIFLPAIVSRVETKKEVLRLETAKVMVGQGRILVIDDEVAIRHLLERLLPRLGYSVEAVKDGQAGIESYKEAMLRGNPFSAVILDLTIPGGMGGKEVMKYLQELDPQVKAIVSSGYSDDPVMSQTERSCCQGQSNKQMF